MKKPVYLLQPGDKFIGDDGRTWTVETITEPDNWRSNLQVGEKPKNWTIRAHTRVFSWHGMKVVELKS